MQKKLYDPTNTKKSKSKINQIKISKIHISSMSKYNGRRDIESQLNLEDRNEGRMLNIIFKRFKQFINNSLKENIFISHFHSTLNDVAVTFRCLYRCWCVTAALFKVEQKF